MRPNSFLTWLNRAFMSVLIFLLFLPRPALGSIDLYGKLESELTYDDLLTAGQEDTQKDTLVNIINFNPKLK